MPVKAITVVSEPAGTTQYPRSSAPFSASGSWAGCGDFVDAKTLQRADLLKEDQGLLADGGVLQHGGEVGHSAAEFPEADEPAARSDPRLNGRRRIVENGESTRRNAGTAVDLARRRRQAAFMLFLLARLREAAEPSHECSARPEEKTRVRLHSQTPFQTRPPFRQHPLNSRSNREKGASMSIELGPFADEDTDIDHKPSADTLPIGGRMLLQARPPLDHLHPPGIDATPFQFASCFLRLSRMVKCPVLLTGFVSPAQQWNPGLGKNHDFAHIVPRTGHVGVQSSSRCLRRFGSAKASVILSPPAPRGQRWTEPPAFGQIEAALGRRYQRRPISFWDTRSLRLERRPPTGDMTAGFAGPSRHSEHG